MAKLTKTVEFVKERFKNAKKFRSPLTKNWDNYYKKWRNFLEDRDDNYRSNLFIPYCFQAVETIIPRLITSKPKIIVLPREPDDEKNADIVEEVLKYQWDRLRMDEKLEIVVRAGLIYGTSFLKVGWSGKMPTVENVDILDLYIDPDSTNVENASYIIHRTLKTVDEIKANPNYKNKKLVEGLSRSKEEEGKAQRLATIGLSDPSEFRDKKGKKLEVLEYWENDRVIAVCEQQVILRDEKNPFAHGRKPFVIFRDYTVPNEFYGVGEIVHIKELQEEANSLRNQIMDNQSLINNRMWKVKRSGGIDPKNVVSKPGGMILVNDNDDVTPIDIQPIPSGAYTMEQVIKSDIQQTTGVTDYQVGPGVSGTSLNKTATGVKLIQEAGNMRFRLKIRHLEETLQKLGELLLANNQEFIQKPFIIRILGDKGNEFTKVKPEDIQGHYDLIPEMGADEPVDKPSQRQQFLNLITILAQPQFTQSINWQKIAKMLLEKFDIDNPEDYLTEAMEGGAVDKLMQMPTEQADQAISQLAPEEQQIITQEMLRRTNEQPAG